MNTEHLRTEIAKVFSFVDKPKGLTLSFHKADCLQCEYLRKDLKKYNADSSNNCNLITLRASPLAAP